MTTFFQAHKFQVKKVLFKKSQNGENGESKGNIARINTSAWAKEIDWDPAQLFNKFFKQDIESLLSMSKLWEKKDRKKPKPMLYEEIVSFNFLRI